jgi:hypothetical protein
VVEWKPAKIVAPSRIFLSGFWHENQAGKLSRKQSAIKHTNNTIIKPMKNNFRRSLLAMAVPTFLAALSAEAANSFYAPGDLILYFQKEGSTNTIYANLGNAANSYRGTSAGTDGLDYTLTKTNILNLNTTLTSAFGSGWASDTSVYAGLAGVFSNSTSTVITDGDPGRTLYVSSGRNSISTATVGTSDSNTWDMTLAGNTAITSAASGIFQQNNAFENNYDAQVTISLTDVSLIDDQNPVSGGFQGSAFNNNLAGGVQQQGTSGDLGFVTDVGNVEFALDLYRILGRGTGGIGGTAPLSGQVSGPLRQGTFEGTVVVGSNGAVSFLVPEPSSALLSGLAAGAFILRRRRRSA